MVRTRGLMACKQTAVDGVLSTGEIDLLPYNVYVWSLGVVLQFERLAVGVMKVRMPESWETIPENVQIVQASS